MQPHDIFKQAYAHIMQQGPSIHAASCKYRNFDGKSCAVGYFIPDEYYDEGMEGAAADELLDTWDLPDWMTEHENDSVLRAVQHAHDTAATQDHRASSNPDFAADFRARMEDVAKDFGWEMPE